MKNSILVSVLCLSVLSFITGCGGSGGSGGGNNPLTATQRTQGAQAQFLPNDPNTPPIALDLAIVGKWSTDCMKFSGGTAGSPAMYKGTITDIRKNGTMYVSEMLFQDPSCTNGMTATPWSPAKKYGKYDLLDLADMQPSGDLHFSSSKKFEKAQEGEALESVLHIVISGKQAQNMQITTNDLMIKSGFRTVESPKSRGKSKLAHRVQGI